MVVMQVQVLFFGMLKDMAGRTTDQVTLPDHSTVADLLAHYETLPRFKQVLPSIAVSVNQHYARPDLKLRNNDEVGLLPPVSGGSDARVGTGTLARPGERSSPTKAHLTRNAIDAKSVIESIKRPEDGAVAVFDGIVRNHSRGRRTLYLDYEAYEPMALKQMDSLLKEARERFQVRDVALIHRLGRLEIGETSVLIVVAAAHRAAAFDACRWLIDTLKKTVPIWKKEYFADGAVWADGEPFPAEISTAAAAQNQHPTD
jgi:molybdopterin synthase catalytic subunit/molybdopterin converting factor small subunit